MNQDGHSFTLISTIEILLSDLDDETKFVIPETTLPETWSVTRQYRLICAHDAEKVPDISWEEASIPINLRRDDIIQIHTSCISPPILSMITRALENRRREGHGSIKSLGLPLVLITPASINAVARAQRLGEDGPGGDTLECLVIFQKAGLTQPAFTIQRLVEVDWPCLRGLKDLMMNVWTERLWHLQGRTISPSAREYESAETPTAYEAPHLPSTSLFACPSPYPLTEPLHLRSFTLHINLSEKYKGDERSIVRVISRILPRATELADILLAIGGPLCRYSIRPGRSTPTSVFAYLLLYCSMVEKDIIGWIERDNEMQEKGWYHMGRATEEQDTYDSD
jgi:hypothetical protein